MQRKCFFFLLFVAHWNSYSLDNAKCRLFRFVVSLFFFAHEHFCCSFFCYNCGSQRAFFSDLELSFSRIFNEYSESKRVMQWNEKEIKRKKRKHDAKLHNLDLCCWDASHFVGVSVKAIRSRRTTWATKRPMKSFSFSFYFLSFCSMSN